MADNYQNIKGTLRPTFKLSPNGVELISKVVPNSTLKELYIKRDTANTEHRLLTEYDMEIPSRAIATYTEVSTNEGDFVIFNLHDGQTLRIPKTISNLEQAGTVIGPEQAVAGNVVTFADNTGVNIDDRGHGIIENMSDSGSVDYSYSKDIPTAKAIWNLVGEAKLLLYARLQGLLDSNGHTVESPEIPEVDNYRLDLTINCLTEVPESFQNIQFVYMYPSIDADYTVEQISTEPRRVYTHTKSGFLTSNSLAFKICVEDSELGAIYVVSEGSTDFVITPDGNNIIKAVVSFAYPSEGNSVIGSFEQQFGGETEYILSNNDKTIKERHIFYNNYVAERSITISDISMTDGNGGQKVLLMEHVGIVSNFTYQLKLDIDNEEIFYSITGPSIVLSATDSAKIDNASLVKVTPIIWEHSLATFIVKGNQ